MPNYLIFKTSWGWMGLSGSELGLTRLVLPCASVEEVDRAFTHRKQKSEVRIQNTEVSRQNNELQEAGYRLQRYFDGYPEVFTDRVDLSGATAFQKQVWLALRDIPYGSTTSYSELAAKLGRTEAVRAIGQALSKNPLPIILPCHRVIGKKGDLVGFSGGLELKKRLLELELRSCK